MRTRHSAATLACTPSCALTSRAGARRQPPRQVLIGVVPDVNLFKHARFKLLVEYLGR